MLEGGSIHVDGKGTLLTTKECLLSQGRNPSMTQKEIENKLKDYLNLRKIIWLDEGIYNDETNGHVDNFACFTEEGKVLNLSLLQKMTLKDMNLKKARIPEKLVKDWLPAMLISMLVMSQYWCHSLEMLMISLL